VPAAKRVAGQEGAGEAASTGLCYLPSSFTYNDSTKASHQSSPFPQREKRVPMTTLDSPLRFPHDLLRFLHWIYFRPFTLQTYLNLSGLPTGSVFELFTRGRQDNAARRTLVLLASFYIWLAPWLLGISFSIVLAWLGKNENWLSLVFYLVLGTMLSLVFSLNFCIAFLLPFSLAAAVVSIGGFTIIHGILFSFLLGLAYGLRLNPAKWGLAAGLVYGGVFALLVNPLSGLAISLAFLIGYFRIFLYVVEVPLSWTLAALSAQGDAGKLWRWNPVVWDELIWFPLPALDRHLQALVQQDKSMGREAIRLVKDSFRQGWAAKRVLVPE
jgi:hypothetical protein